MKYNPSYARVTVTESVSAKGGAPRKNQASAITLSLRREVSAGAENGEKCGDSAGVAERAQTGEGSWNTCIAKCGGICLLNGLKKGSGSGFSFFFSLSSGFRASGMKLEPLWKTRSRFFLSEDNGSLLFAVLKMISFCL